MDITKFMYGANPSAQRALNPTNSLGTLSQIMSDPSVLSLMAGVGSRMDPEGAGGSLGVSAQEMIQSRAAGNEAERQAAMMKRLIETLGGRSGTVKSDPKGGTTIKIDPDDKDKSGLKTPQDEALGDISQPSNMERGNSFSLGTAGSLDILSNSIFGRR